LVDLALDHRSGDPVRLLLTREAGSPRLLSKLPHLGVSGLSVEGRRLSLLLSGLGLLRRRCGNLWLRRHWNRLRRTGRLNGLCRGLRRGGDRHLGRRGSRRWGWRWRRPRLSRAKRSGCDRLLLGGLWVLLVHGSKSLLLGHALRHKLRHHLLAAELRSSSGVASGSFVLR
jgi:hypothetical protein